MDWLLPIAFFALAIGLRLLPHRLAPHGVGVDHWYWKAYIEKYRETKKFPPELPQFIFDDRQWYPPVFPVLSSLLPSKIFDEQGHWLAAFIDIVRMLVLVVLVYWCTDGDATACAIAALIYALTPILITYNLQLNPRGLGALFVDVIVFLSIGIFWFQFSLWWLFPVALMSGVLLLTHKMSTQLFWFLCLFTSVFTLDWRPLALIPMSIVAALLISKGFYHKVLITHWEYVSFWNKHWPWLSAHPIVESPVYGQPGVESSNKYFAAGMKGLLHRVSYLGGFNPWAWMLAVITPAILISSKGLHGAEIQPEALLLWLVGVLAFVLLTTFLPFMRALGNGYLYVYNASFPAALLAAYLWKAYGPQPLLIAGLLAALGASLAVCSLYFRALRESKTLKVDGDLLSAAEYLRGLSGSGPVMCFPQHWHDLVAYKSGKFVLFGGHGYGVTRLEPIFPRVMKPIKNVINHYQVTHLLTYQGYLPDNFIADLPAAEVSDFGLCRLYSFQR